MTINNHKILNQFFYVITLSWGEWEIMQIFKHKYFIIFLISFVYSILLTFYYKIVNYLIESKNHKQNCI